MPIIGVAKAGWTLDQLKARAQDSLAHHGGADPADARQAAGLLRYVDGDYNDPATFTQLRKRTRRREAAAALSGGAAQPVRDRGGGAREVRHAPTDARLVIEKPFGHDRATARALERDAAHAISPRRTSSGSTTILGKEPVQNILYTRFANPMFEPIWNRDHVRSIQITMAEDFGVQDRGRFYDETGAIRDVLQNHMLQVLAHL